jgi:hypothetical protein
MPRALKRGLNVRFEASWKSCWGAGASPIARVTGVYGYVRDRGRHRLPVFL